jgi:hypothetical protein
MQNASTFFSRYCLNNAREFFGIIHFLTSEIQRKKEQIVFSLIHICLRLLFHFFKNWGLPQNNKNRA